MVSIPNRFYRGIVHGKSHPKFRFIIVDTVADFKDIEGNWYTDSFESYTDYLLYDRNNGDIFYGVYGSYFIDNPRSSCKITETNSLNEAIHIAQEIMGNSIIETTDSCSTQTT
jgi:hypothetical protein